MDRFITIMRKEFLHILRDARTLAMILLLPGLLLVFWDTAFPARVQMFLWRLWIIPAHPPARNMWITTPPAVTLT